MFSSFRLAALGRLALVELVLLTMGGMLGTLTHSGMAEWYGLLEKSALTPPDWVFGVVWTILYLMIGFVFWRLWEQRTVLPARRMIFQLFAAQMVLNWAWTPLFFTAHWIVLSFFWLVGLVAVLGALLTVLAHADRLSAWLLAPYALWCAFASYLTGFIWFANV